LASATDLQDQCPSSPAGNGLGHLEEWLLALLEEGCLPFPAPGKPWASNPTNLINDAKCKVPRLRDLSFNDLATFLKEWGCDKSGGDARYWRFPPLTEMRAVWDRRYIPREWSAIADWSYEVRPPNLLDGL
jgi:hypothetical protein